MLNAGPGFVSYNWDSGLASSQTFSVSQGGKHTVIVTDGNSCKDTASSMLSVYSKPVVNLGNDTNICDGDFLTLDAGAGFISYFWTTPYGSSSLQTVGAWNAGFYKAKVTDINGCVAHDTMLIYVNPRPTVSLGNTDISACDGELITLDAGLGFSSYKWSLSSVQQAITSTYSITADKQNAKKINIDIWDANGCHDADSILVLGHPCDTIFKITGTVFSDLNQNGTQDNGELGLKNVPVYAQTANYYFASNTDESGNYSVEAFETGTVNVSVQLPYNSQLISPSSPAYHSIAITNLNDSSVDKHFAIHFLPEVHDVQLFLFTTNARPGFDTWTYATIYNKGTVTEKNITLDLAYDNILTPGASSIPYTNSNHILTFAIDSIKAGNIKFVTIDFNVPQGANHLGHQLDYFGDVSVTTNDVFFADNKDTCSRIITGSYDPNFKESKLGEGNISPTTDEMEYTIHFQNTGTDTAFTVVVKDSLNKAVFDYKAVEMLCASHDYNYSIDTAGVIAFTFNNILLPDSTTNEAASHGFVKFKVKLNHGLNVGTVLKNKAYIYFDFNAPIITNEATNTLSNSVGVNEISNLNFKVYPNPSNDKITLVGSSASLYSVELYDVLGKRVYAQSNIQNTHVVNVSSLEKGIYFVSILQGGKQQIEKVIVQ